MGEDRVSSRATIVAKLNKLPNTITSDGEDKDQEVKIVRFVWIPNCPTRLAWDLSGAFLLLHDMIFFPLSAVEPLDGFTYFIAADIFMMLFWTLDMAGSFITAYYSKGQLILDHRRIAMHYIKTWFLLDIAIVFPDWLQMLVNTGDGGDSFKVLKILRIARIARLTRLMKLKRLMATAGDMVNSEYVSVIFTVIKLFIFMLFVTHFIGCTWYMVGTSTVNTGNPQNWIQIHDFLEEPFLYRYFTTLHWSITQFTPGSMHVQPQNLRERIFAVIVLLFGMIIFSSFVSSMTSAMTALRAIHAGVSKQLWLLRRYLRENNVDRALSFRILRYVEHQTASQEDNLQESRVDLLKSLSDQLRLELKVATTMQPLRVHPILAQFHDGAPITVQQVVRQAVSVKNLAMSDTMFNNKQIASQMYVAASGQLSYTLRKKRTFPVKKGIWVSEAVLWTAWQHAGDLQAATDCRVLCIDQDAFGKVIVNSPPAKDLASQHAREFIEWLNNCGVEEHTDAPCDEEYRTMMLNFAKTQNQRNSLSWQVDQIQAVSV